MPLFLFPQTDVRVLIPRRWWSFYHPHPTCGALFGESHGPRWRLSDPHRDFLSHDHPYPRQLDYFETQFGSSLDRLIHRRVGIAAECGRRLGFRRRYHREMYGALIVVVVVVFVVVVVVVFPSNDNLSHKAV